MFIQTQTRVREATPNDLRRLANLIHFEAYVHSHLDYRPPLDWMGRAPFLIVEQNKPITAALACPPDPPQVAWLRLFAASGRGHLANAWTLVWEEARARLGEIRTPLWTAAIPMQTWFEDLLLTSHFKLSHRIVTLHWEPDSLPPITAPADTLIRPMTLDDLERVERVDITAFPPIWQHSRAYLELAFRQAAIASVAETGGRIVGYQISTATPLGGHLARLAVEPQRQGHGIGHALLHDVLAQFMRRGARAVTVNTQTNNHASLAVYQKMGFTRTSEEYPVYQIDLK